MLFLQAFTCHASPKPRGKPEVVLGDRVSGEMQNKISQGFALARGINGL
jgi:hypothetical protein